MGEGVSKELTFLHLLSLLEHTNVNGKRHFHLPHMMKVEMKEMDEVL